MRTVRIIGAGIVAAFAVRAVRDTLVDFEHEIVVYSPDGIWKLPPSGAFYLHDVPESIKQELPEPDNHVEIVHGHYAGGYADLMWGDRKLPTSVDKIFQTPGRQRWLKVWKPSWDMMAELIAGSVNIVKGMVTKASLLAMVERYPDDYFISTVGFDWGNKPNYQSFPILEFKDFVNVDLRKSTVDGRRLNSRHYAHKLGYMQALGHATKQILDGRNSVTGYNCTNQGSWLRYTLSEDNLSVELRPDFADATLYSSTQEGREDHAAALEVLEEATWQRKIHPNDSSRNQSPFPNLILTGRWATLDRKELSHETYYTVCSRLKELSAVRLESEL